jgi:peptidoglycan/LPS O-acetylase OafA/YrhL
MRGIAAVQVVLLHFVTGFLPSTAENAPAPLRVLWDGHTAVYVFFLISGAVLTPSFARGGIWSRQAAKRVVRLGLPVAAAASIALLLVAAMPDAHLDASRISGSAWLAMDSSGARTVTHLVREITLDSLVLGYREYTLFAPIAGRLPVLEHALNAPSWSLHLELYGSFLLLWLVKLHAWVPRIHVVAVAVCALTFGTHPMFLFVLGHLCAVWLRKPLRLTIGTSLAGAILIAVGLVLSATKSWDFVETARIAIERYAPAAAPNSYQFQSQLSAMALFAGVLLSPSAQRWLARCGYLGRLSFSIYLLHFPILFTLGCAGFIWLAGVLPQPAAVAVTFVVFASIVVVAAIAFERVIDRRAVHIGQLIDRRRRVVAV